MSNAPSLDHFKGEWWISTMLSGTLTVGMPIRNTYIISYHDSSDPKILPCEKHIYDIEEKRKLTLAEIQYLTDAFRRYYGVPWKYKDYMVQYLMRATTFISWSPNITDFLMNEQQENVDEAMVREHIRVHASCTNPLCDHNRLFCNICPNNIESQEVFQYILMLNYICSV